jgi:hypothetical protein
VWWLMKGCRLSFIPFVFNKRSSSSLASFEGRVVLIIAAGFVQSRCIKYHDL